MNRFLLLQISLRLVESLSLASLHAIGEIISTIHPLASLEDIWTSTTI